MPVWRTLSCAYVVIEAITNVDKLTFGSGAGDTDDLKDHDVVTGTFAAVDDS